MQTFKIHNNIWVPAKKLKQCKHEYYPRQVVNGKADNL